MDVSRLFLHFTPTGLQKGARRNCASSLVEQAVSHAESPEGPSMVVRTGLLRPGAGNRSTTTSG